RERAPRRGRRRRGAAQPACVRTTARLQISPALVPTQSDGDALPETASTLGSPRAPSVTVAVGASGAPAAASMAAPSNSATRPSATAGTGLDSITATSAAGPSSAIIRAESLPDDRVTAHTALDPRRYTAVSFGPPRTRSSASA